MIESQGLAEVLVVAVDEKGLPVELDVDRYPVAGVAFRLLSRAGKEELTRIDVDGKGCGTAVKIEETSLPEGVRMALRTRLLELTSQTA